ncbi:alpha-galactosidase [Staphylococcus delphini]|uniref:alpha-galactosidase n=2 Tax=Staphylococcus delphini TaxID=53344 RepID=UPI0015CB43BE|nr:alpha-galactosidase [Staphylococcus delphini]
MTIHISKMTRQFHLTNGDISYIFYIGPTELPVQLYTGPAVQDDDYTFLVHQQSRPVACYPRENDTTFSYEHAFMEYPNFGTGDFRDPAFEVILPNKSQLTTLEYRGYQVLDALPHLDGLPHIRDNQVSGQTLIIELIDLESGLEVQLYYVMLSNMNVIARHVVFKNSGEMHLRLSKALSLSVDLPCTDYKLTHLSGAWGRERHVTEQPLGVGTFKIQSLRGHSSHLHNPFFALSEPHITEHQGFVYGFALAYSGNFIGQVEVDNFNQLRAQIGIHPDHFMWELAPGSTFTTPQAFIVMSDSGFNGMSQHFHQFIRMGLTAPRWQQYERPILVNNWEATYYDFTEDKLLTIAKQAKDIGIEMFVLDDGWFGNRQSDHEGLGDFTINKKKLPHGLPHLVNQINALGLDFGLWVEPEMVSKKSELYAAHPEWVIKVPHRSAAHGRFQYVLDYTNPDVIAYIDEALSEILSSSPISYIKWDMNRSMTDVYSSYLDTNQQGEVYHRYILGLYQLLDRLTQKFPHVLIESCASGGGRFDLGMLYYTPQIWTSDNTDAYQRQLIQYGTSYVYPPNTMGAHVSQSPNEQEHRHISLQTRGHVSYFGVFGYELDLSQMHPNELEIMKTQVQFVKQHRKLLQFGRFYRLLNPSKHNYTAWMVVDDAQTTALLAVYKHLNVINIGKKRIKLSGLDPQRYYHVSNINQTLSGAALMNIGFDIPDTSYGELRNGEHKTYDFDSWLFEIKEILNADHDDKQKVSHL